MVIGSVRACANQDPDLKGGVWNPWFEGRAANAAGERWKNDEGPDSSFLKAMVECVGTKYKLDGISSGATMTNRALLFRSDFWAGGMPISGESYTTRDDGSFLPFQAAREAVKAAPEKIHQGRVGPFPLPASLGPMIVITVWGGERDLWNCGPPIGLCSDYRPTTLASSNYFSSMPNVVHVACTAGHGHMWPQANTQAFNLWALTTLASFPKGSKPGEFHLTTPPEGYSCRVGRFIDHY